MKKPKLDLSKPNCHCCDNPLMRDVKNLKEKCVHYSCSAKGVNFNIPFLDEGEKPNEPINKLHSKHRYQTINEKRNQATDKAR